MQALVFLLNSKYMITSAALQVLIINIKLKSVFKRICDSAYCHHINAELFPIFSHYLECSKCLKIKGETPPVFHPVKVKTHCCSTFSSLDKSADDRGKGLLTYLTCSCVPVVKSQFLSNIRTS